MWIYYQILSFKSHNIIIIIFICLMVKIKKSRESSTTFSRSLGRKNVKAFLSFIEIMFTIWVNNIAQLDVTIFSKGLIIIRVFCNYLYNLNWSNICLHIFSNLHTIPYYSNDIKKIPTIANLHFIDLNLNWF